MPEPPEWPKPVVDRHNHDIVGLGHVPAIVESRMTDHVAATMNPDENRNPVFTLWNVGRIAVLRVDIEKQTIFAAQNFTLVTRDATEATRELRTE